MRDVFDRLRQYALAPDGLDPGGATDAKILGAAALRELQLAELEKIDPSRPRSTEDFRRVEVVRRIVDDYLFSDPDSEVG